MRMNPPAFYGAAVLILTFAGIVIGFPEQAGRWLLAAQAWAADSVGWYYLLAMTLYLIFVVVTALSGYGKIKLGADHDEPEFSYLSWAGMLFAAGISITLFFFCVSEPLTHFLQPPQGTAGTPEAARQAMQLLFLHWGLHGWGVFALVAMALAYFAYRHNLPLALRSALYPLIGKRINGPIGYTVDCFGIIATVFGLGADMGFGVLQLNAGLDFLFGIAHSHPVQMTLIALMMGAAITVAVSGVDKGIRLLSDINMLLACALLLFVLFAGPTQHLLNTLVQNIGDYLGSLPTKSFDLYAYQGGEGDWLGGWTVFYWAWWIAWSPFVGLFIARISRGRTIREFVFGVLFIPLGFTLAWMSIFGNSALDQVLNHGFSELGRVAVSEPSMALYQMLQNYPGSRAVIAVTVLVSFVFFVTSADSGTVVLSTLSAHGGSAEDDGPKWLRVFWGVVTALVTGGLLFAGSMDALKSAVVLTSLPFSLILLLMMWGLHKAFYLESQRQRARTHSLAPLSPKRGGWKRRISQAVHFPTRDEVFRFMDDVVRPAIAEVAEVFREKGLQVESDLDPSNLELGLEIGHGEQHPFLYQVSMRGYFTPSFARAGIGGLHLNNRRYFRAEVHLAEGSQDYDLVGYNREQIINDILDQYERHLQFLHLVR